MPVPLVESSPPEPPADPCRHERIELVSRSDGRPHAVDVYAPARARGPLPVVVGFHPVGWTAREDYWGGLEGLKRGHHRGWHGLADGHDVLVAMPEGHSRRVDLCSLASPEQIDDVDLLLDVLPERGFDVDPSRVYAAGLSMGGLEALVAAGRLPHRFAAVAAFNPVIDLAAWQEDLARSPVEEIREFGTDERIAEEVGGTPAEVPDAYRERSATAYTDALVTVPLLLAWTRYDLVVPRQETHHAYALYRLLKERGAGTPACEWEHTAAHALGELTTEIRWQLHEWCDYELALAWLSNHRKGDLAHGQA